LAGVAAVFNLAGPAQAPPKQIAAPGKMIVENRQLPSLSAKSKTGILNQSNATQVSKKETHFHNLTITLPNVTDAPSFADELKQALEGYDA